MAAKPPPPKPPPPAPYLERRAKADEQDWDPDCDMVSYAQCRGAVADYARDYGTADVLQVSIAPCEGLEDEPACFLGCQYGGPNGGLYRFLLPDMELEFNASNPKRCKFAEMPYCACANPASPPPLAAAPPPPMAFTEDFHGFPSYRDGETPVLGGGVTDPDVPWTPDDGQASALVKRLANARTIDLALRSSHRVVDCAGPTDDGEQTCARYCAAEHHRAAPLP